MRVSTRLAGTWWLAVSWLAALALCVPFWHLLRLWLVFKQISWSQLQDSKLWPTRLVELRRGAVRLLNADGLQVLAGTCCGTVWLVKKMRRRISEVEGTSLDVVGLDHVENVVAAITVYLETGSAEVRSIGDIYFLEGWLIMQVVVVNAFGVFRAPVETASL